MSAAERDLAPYAATSELSRGRQHLEASPRYRTEYQRDRDRVVHSTAFRRLVYKTQVFVNHEGDLYRTRLTHSLEVAQIARSTARALRLNEDLVEAISLAHDLGHTPFGHAGQDALDECMRDYGGFEHNLQSLRVVDKLEAGYASFDGLNLTYETREGILKHCSRRNARGLGELGQRFLERKQPGLEAQIANVADQIAYNNHDVDDGLRSGLLTLDQLETIPFFAAQAAATRAAFAHVSGVRLARETIRRMIDELVTDLIDSSKQRIDAAAPGSIDAVRNLAVPLIGSSTELASAQHALKRFLHEHLYAHPRVARMTREARETITFLFSAFMENVDLMPDEHAERAKDDGTRHGEAGAARTVADYIAGMTDRFALQVRDRLAGGEPGL